MMLDELQTLIDTTIGPWAKAQGIEGLPVYALDEPPAGIDADVACNLALLLAKPLKKSPRAIAQELQTLLSSSKDLIKSMSIAGAGFLNFKWTLARLQSEMKTLLSDPAHYGMYSKMAGQKILIEFVSANPTGPLHVGHGRGAALGDSLALILAHLGAEVTREFYVNDAGNQVKLLGESVLARVQQLSGKEVALPEEGYHGEYIRDVAQDFLRDDPLHAGDPTVTTAYALKTLTSAIEKDLLDFGVRFDRWFSESSLVQGGAVDRYVQVLRERGHVEEHDDALWFVSPSDAQKKEADAEPEQRDKNRVLKKRDGRWTYFASDIAYHADKFDRGYTQLIDLWGADHHGYVARVKGSMQALGHNPDHLHVVLYQLVSLTRDGVPVAMSKRSGDFIRLREVLDEVGKDACRFFFALRGPNTALDFDLELAKKQSADNPVFYLQYAHARICSIFRQAVEKKVPVDTVGSSSDLSPLHEKEERDLMRRLSLFPQVLRVCAQDDSPHPLATYLLSMARQFHHFYDHHRVLGEEAQVTQARLALLKAVRDLLRVGLNLLGVSAPETM